MNSISELVYALAKDASDCPEEGMICADHDLPIGKALDLVRALEDTGRVAATYFDAMQTAEARAAELEAAAKEAATALDQSSGDRYAIEARGILRAALSQPKETNE